VLLPTILDVNRDIFRDSLDYQIPLRKSSKTFLQSLKILPRKFPPQCLLNPTMLRGSSSSSAMVSGPPGLLLAVCLLLVLLVPGTEATASTGSGNVGVGMPSEQQQQMLWGGAAAVISSLRSISLALQSLFDRVSAQRLSRGDHSGM
jgi:hypothetical protein